MQDEDATTTDRLVAAVERFYREYDGTDYTLPPIVVGENGEPVGRIRPTDSVVFCCRRGEREEQLTRAFVDDPFMRFERKLLDPLTFVPLTLYHPDFRHLPVAFAPQAVSPTLGEVVSYAGLQQLRLAEREKFAHVTYFFSGGRADPFPGETDRAVESSLTEPTRALPRLVDVLREELNRMEYALVVVNLATGDIVGHYVDLAPKVRCAEAVDQALGDILDLARRRHYPVGVAADHGLLEDHGPPGGPVNVSHTAHSIGFTVADADGYPMELAPGGALRDVAPTLLPFLGLRRPGGMTGRCLLRSSPTADGRPGRVMLVILDGWGLPESGHVNPIASARTPTWNSLARGPMVPLAASGEAVGLLPGRKGNSEAGHLNLGAGATVLQDEVRIERAIADGSFRTNPALRQATRDARERSGALHVIGLLSERSSHGAEAYAFEVLRLAKEEGLPRVFVHWISDGRSTAPRDAPERLRAAAATIEAIGAGSIATLVGRGLALDRGGNYTEKTKPVYRALTH